MRVLVWTADGRGRELALTQPPGGGLVVSETDAEPPAVGVAGAAVLADEEGWASDGSHPLGALFYSGPTRDDLLDLVSQGAVDSRAPSQAAGQVVVQAGRRAVWEALADVSRWPDIRADIADVEVRGPARPGTSFVWTGGAVRFVSTFGAMEEGVMLTWVSTAPGVTVAHVYRIDEAPGGGARLSCRESLAGPLVAAFVPSAVLQAGVDSWLQGVKALVESRAERGLR